MACAAGDGGGSGVAPRPLSQLQLNGRGTCDPALPESNLRRLCREVGDLGRASEKQQARAFFCSSSLG
jgi:hypothetical protein